MNMESPQTCYWRKWFLYFSNENLELGDDKKISQIYNDHFVMVGERMAGQMPRSDNSLAVHIPKTNSAFQLKPVTEG